jgi:hypothetical protein
MARIEDPGEGPNAKADRLENYSDDDENHADDGEEQREREMSDETQNPTDDLD